MDINYLAIIIATVLQFAFGAVWYGPIFGKLWGKIHGFDKLSKEVQQQMMKEMGPYYAVQFIVTLITTVILSIFSSSLPESWNIFSMAFLIWLGFVVPAQVSAAIFGGAEKPWLVKKVALQAGAALACLEIAAAILHFL